MVMRVRVWDSVHDSFRRLSSAVVRPYWGQGRMGGHAWEYFERYRDNSPFFFFDRVTAPVLLLHGGSDPVVEPQAAIESFVALRRLGKQVTLVLYDGERHHPGEWGADNAADYWSRIIAWLAAHLRT
jgi:dipeptidyl aminopeptidase/acylaminoacyl peptidase